VYLSSESLPPKGQKAVPAPSEIPSKKKPMASVPNDKGLSLSPDQEKAINLILSGKSFVMIAMSPTKELFDGKLSPCDAKDATGCDFHTCLHGDSETLIAAKDELPNVLNRLYTKKGLL
jgi:hypothetical protein